MYRRQIAPRADWQKIVESQGMHYHTFDGVPYWDESVYYEFTSAEIDRIEEATYALDKMCLAAVEHVIEQGLFYRFLIPPMYHDFLRRSWDRDEHTIYGRFDLVFDGQFAPKLLEYNADTPTSLLEAAVVQWYWLKDRFPEGDQFNSLHERLLGLFRTLRQEIPERFYFTAMGGHIEDCMNVNYLRDLAMQAGFETEYLNIEDLGWNATRGVFTDLQEREIGCCFKLYPWEWMQREQFGPHLIQSSCHWFEPPWKALLSNKAILAVLWELFPESPYLLRTSFEPLSGGTYVKKPILGREGANVQIFDRGRLLLETDGPYDGPAVFQAACPLPRFENRFFAVVGSWIVDGWASGIGIREDESLITGDLSRFVPHRIA